MPFFLLALHSLWALANPLIPLPNFKQTDQSMDCAPVAAANSLYWLSQQGYDRLVPDKNDSKALATLVENLAREMKTREMKGTFPNRFCLGVEKYVTQKGYGIKRLEYRGNGHVPRQFGEGHLAPSIDWIQAGLTKKSVVWIGLNRVRRVGLDYEKTSGHWVSVVGVDGDTIIVRNPSSHNHVLNQTLKTHKILQGNLTGKKQDRVPLVGYLEVDGGPELRRRADTVILSSAILLELQ